ASFRRTAQAQNLDGHGRTRRLNILAAIIDERADTAPFGARDDDVADMKRAALDENGAHRAAAPIEFCLDDDALGRTIRIGLEIENFGLEKNRFLEFVEPHAGLGGD